jgi:CcmD family protein
MQFLKINKKLFFLSLCLLAANVTMAQTADNGIDMADALRSSGKIFVVVACVAVIFVGILIYLITLDRKITKLEKQLDNK